MAFLINASQILPVAADCTGLATDDSTARGGASDVALSAIKVPDCQKSRWLVAKSEGDISRIGREAVTFGCGNRPRGAALRRRYGGVHHDSS